MSSYLSIEKFKNFVKEVTVFKISSLSHDQLLSYDFKCEKAKEYESFLFDKAEQLDKLAISKTYIMVHNKTNELIGYFTLSTDTIKLTPEEKDNADLSEVSFMTLPAIKLGKLAINKNLLNPKKGYGSFAIELATIKAYEVLKSGVACRFLTVDADVEYDKDTPNFYLKNGFVFNESKKRKITDKTISMRKDIFNNIL